MFFLQVGGQPEEAVKSHVNGALEIAAVASGIATPSAEPMTELAAAKTAFVSYLISVGLSTWSAGRDPP